MSQPTADSRVAWLETTATVTSCKYRFARMNPLTLGIPSNSNQFLIGFTYRAHGQEFSGEFTSAAFLEQGHTLTITYNPLAPQQNSKAANALLVGTPLFAFGIAGSILLSLLYLAMLHGCR